jgi:hypothetical protein
VLSGRGAVNPSRANGSPRLRPARSVPHMPLSSHVPSRGTGRTAVDYPALLVVSVLGGGECGVRAWCVRARPSDPPCGRLGVWARGPTCWDMGRALVCAHKVSGCRLRGAPCAGCQASATC